MNLTQENLWNIGLNQFRKQNNVIFVNCAEWPILKILFSIYVPQLSSITWLYCPNMITIAFFILHHYMCTMAISGEYKLHWKFTILYYCRAIYRGSSLEWSNHGSFDWHRRTSPWPPSILKVPHNNSLWYLSLSCTLQNLREK